MDINEAVAVLVMDYPRTKARAEYDAWLRAAIEDVKRDNPLLNEKNIQHSKFVWPPNYTSDEVFWFRTHDRHGVEKRIDALGLRDAYIRALIDLVAPGASPIEAAWALLDVTNEQRCLAALQVMEHRL